MYPSTRFETVTIRQNCFALDVCSSFVYTFPLYNKYIYIYISVGRWRVVAVKQWRDIISACILYNIYVCVCNTNKFSFVIKYYFAISVHPYLHFSPTRSLRVSQADCLGWDKRPNSSGHDLYLLLLFSVYYDIISLAKHCEYRRLHTIILNV